MGKGLAVGFVALVAALAASVPATAEMRPVEVRNASTRPIYKLYGWPSDLVPRTVNLLPAPIRPGESRTLSVEDAFNSCVFSFQADFNNPRRTLRRIRAGQRRITLAFRDGIDLCEAERRPVVFR